MKYFLDCGSHHGEGLLTLIEKYNIDKDWTIFCFEPNTESFNRLINNNLDLNITYLNKCVTDKNGFTLFHAETTTESYGGNDDVVASTCIDINDWNPKNNNNHGAGEFHNSYQVETVDFSEFINSLNDIEFLLVKLDIEGSEYNVLRHLINTDTIKKINDMYVEFHDWAMKSETPNTTNQLINDINNTGVNITRWW